MTRTIELRPGTAQHYDFALALYIMTMRPYAEKLMAWDEPRQLASFAAQWNVDDVRIVVVDGQAIGWLQAAEMPAQIVLQQFFIMPGHQGMGIGTEVLRSLLLGWQAAAKPVALEVLKNNPAIRLYQRLGFSIVGESGVKWAMRRSF
jgi:ribosomal protein S18 acetylase RimI-like enzyme